MKKFAGAVFSAALIASAVTVFAVPSSAQVSVGIGIGVPGPYGAPFYGPNCAYPGYNPYCDYGYYDGPVFIDGVWIGGGHWPHRYWGGHHQFYYNGAWRNGGWGRGGHWGGRGGWHGGGHGHR